MRLFLVVFLSVYGAMQGYVYWRIHAAWRLRGWPRAAVIVFLALMLAGPALTRWLDRADWFRTAQVYGAVTYTWMAVSMWVFCFGLLADVWNTALRVAAHWAPGAARWAAEPRSVALALAGAILVLLAWGLVEARLPRVNTFTIRTPRLPAGSPPIRVVHISDMHLGLLERDALLKRVAGVVERLKPDLLVSAGDMLDSTGTHMDGLSAALASIRPPLGKFAVTGNHDYYAGLDESLGFHERSGFRVLRQESAVVEGRLRVVGVDDPAGAMTGSRPRLDEDKALPPPGAREFTILLKHRPGVRPASEGRFDLQLSGHTHGGQIFPFTVFAAMEYGERRNGFFRLAGGAHLYISRGTGTWGPPLRVLAPPEVALFIIEPDQPRRLASRP